MNIEAVNNLHFAQFNLIQTVENRVPAIQTFLKPSDMKEAFEKQGNRLDCRNMTIVVTCTVVIVVAIITTSVFIGVLGMQSVPMVMNQLGKMVIADKVVYQSYLLLAIVGSAIGAPLLGLATFFTGCCISNSLLRKHREFATRIDALPDERLSPEMTSAVVCHADNGTLLTILPKMDFDQLKITFNILKKRRFTKILIQNQVNSFHRQAWLNIIHLINNDRTAQTLEAKRKLYDEMNVYKRYISGFSEIALKAMRGTKNPFQLQLVKALTSVSDEHIEEHTVPVTLTRNKLEVAKLEVSSLILAKYSNFMTVAIGDLKFGDELELEVEDPEAFIELIHLLEGNSDGKAFTPHMMKRVFICANKYMDRFADALRASFNDRQLRQMLPKGKDLQLYLNKRNKRVDL